MSKAKQKGTLAETAVADYLKKDFPSVERRVLGGANDKGDLSGVPCSVVEIKNQKTYKVHEWLKETEQERLNADEDLGILVIKPKGIGVSRVEDWWTVVPLDTMIKLIKAYDAQRLQP